MTNTVIMSASQAPTQTGTGAGTAAKLLSKLFFIIIYLRGTGLYSENIKGRRGWEERELERKGDNVGLHFLKGGMTGMG